MTHEEKYLLLKDLCARLPYGVIVKQDDGFSQRIEKVISIYTDSIGSSVHLNTSRSLGFPIEDIKPYLRPMSSMTEEEENAYEAINCYEGLFPCNEDALDYALEHHLDFRGLIPKGFALEAPEGMYV